MIFQALFAEYRFNLGVINFRQYIKYRNKNVKKVRLSIDKHSKYEGRFSGVPFVARSRRIIEQYMALELDTEV